MRRLISLAAITIVVCIVLLAQGCAGKPRMAIAENTACPELGGSYCAAGLRWEEGSTELQPAYLQFYLGLEKQPGWKNIDRVDLDGASGGVLTIILRSGEVEVDRAVIRQPDLVCGADYAAVQMQTIPWGGSGLLLDVGASAGWQLFQRRPDGSLRVEEQRHETGTVFLVMPLYFSSNSSLKFSPYDDALCGGSGATRLVPENK